MAEEKKVEKGAKKPNDKKKKSGKNPFKAIVSFFKSVNSERKKVVWPTAKETLKNAAIVLVVAVIVGVGIYAVDSVLSLGMEGLRNLAPERTTVSEVASDGTTADTSAKAEDDKDETDKAEGTTAADKATEKATENTTGSTAGNSSEE